MAKKITPPTNAKELPQVIVKQMLTLATSGFSLVAALAWNEFIKEAISTYIKPYLPSGSAIISLFLYAVIVTVLAVLVTLQLTKIQSILKQNEM